MIMRKILYACFLTVSVTSMSGCGVSTLTYRDTNPIIQDINSNGNTSFTTLAATASRRMVVVLENKNNGEMKICAEPSPDVGEAFASAIANAISAKIPVKGVETELSDQYTRAVSTQIASLIYRTQGLQLYRDAMHNLCVDKLNGWSAGAVGTLSSPNVQLSDSYESLRQYYFDESVKLITAELANIKDVSSIKAGDNLALDKVIDSTTKLLNAVKPTPADKPTPATAGK